MKNILNQRARSTSALAILASMAFATTSFADMGNQVLGMSRDGSVYLEQYRDGDGPWAFRLVSTTTDNVTQINIPNFEIRGAKLSGDGKTVVGWNDDRESTFIWRSNGTHTISSEYDPILVDDTGEYFVIFDGDNNLLHGSLTNDNTSITPAPGYTPILGFENSDFNPEPVAISADGTTVVGNAARGEDDTQRAFVWNSTDKVTVDIEAGDDITDYDTSGATHVSDNGSVVGGMGQKQGETKVFRWTKETQEVHEIGHDASYGYMDLAAISSDGGVFVGTGHLNGDFLAYRYDAATDTTTNLGHLGDYSSKATDVSSDGKIVIGNSSIAEAVTRGFRWSEETGMISVDQWLEDAGVTLDATTSSALFVSDNGNVITGLNSDGNVYWARVGGIIDTTTYFPTVVAANSVTVQNGVSSANTIMFGAQGNPMRNLLTTGQRSIWGTVDGGYDDNKSAKGGLFLGDFGFGYGIADGITARFSVGGTFTDQDLAAGGDVRQRGFYLSPEVSANLGNDIYATVGGYWGRGSIDINRGYLNGATLDFSKGETDADTWGAKIRFDWLNAATIADTNITPYVGLSYAHTTLDAYTETGGSFPVSYGETKDHSTVARLGADFVHPLSDNLRLLAKAEVDYQFENRSAATTGTVIGLSDFNLAGQDLKQFWVRGGIGAEVDVGGGTASVMINATTQGQEPDVWVRSNFTVKF